MKKVGNDVTDHTSVLANCSQICELSFLTAGENHVVKIYLRRKQGTKKNERKNIQRVI